MLHWRIPHDHPGFTFVRRWYLKYHPSTIVISIITVILFSVEAIDLRLFRATFPPSTGVYFPMIFTLFSINIGFVLLASWFIIKGQVTKPMRQRRWKKYFLLIGFFEAINSILFFYSTYSDRVSPPLASILSQSSVVFSFVFSSMFLHKHYNRLHSLSIGLIVVGILMSLVPTFTRINNTPSSYESSPHVSWSFAFIAAYIPYALLRITLESLQTKFYQFAIENQEKVTRFSIIYLRSMTSTFQTIFIVLAFGLDLIPGFGTSFSMKGWWTSFKIGFQCFFNFNDQGYRCSDASFSGILYIVFSVFSLILTTFLTDHTSANWVAIVTATSSIITICFWFSCSAANDWIGGTPFNNLDIGFTLSTLVIVLVGGFIYRFAGSDRKITNTNDDQCKRPHEIFW